MTSPRNTYLSASGSLYLITSQVPAIENSLMLLLDAFASLRAAPALIGGGPAGV
jgi:hypothetical protein